MIPIIGRRLGVRLILLLIEELFFFLYGVNSILEDL
jgi:hypothetical protein